ncbi:transglutaminase domain-containing protein [Gorillibacterium sp. sgz5001074]|uniref:transglutaminase family protein n=1 Tax=Gorillibacterium sp. sgz5001074 TaxID=3446695 RepID=UPI003F669DDB
MTASFKTHLFPILFASSIVMATLSMYTSMAFVAAIAAILFNAWIFRFCDFVRGSGKAGSALYGLALVAYAALFLVVTSVESATQGNFITAIKYGSLSYSYLFLLFAGACWFYSSAVFYFTKVSYRNVVLVMLLFIPSLLSVSQHKQVPAMDLALMIALYFAVVIDHRKQEFADRSEAASGKVYHQAVIAIAVILFALSWVMPKSHTTPYNVLKTISDKGSAKQLGEFSRQSSVKPEGAQLEDNHQVLFEVQADEPLYVKRQVFGRYDGLTWQVLKNEELANGRADWRDTEKNLNGPMLFELIQEAVQADSAFARKYGLQADKLPHVTLEPRTAAITHKNFSTAYIPHPLNTFGIEGIPAYMKIYQDPEGVLFVGHSDRLSAGESYILTYYSGEKLRESPQFAGFSNRFDYAAYRVFLEDLSKVFQRSKNTEGLSLVLNYVKEARIAGIYQSDSGYKPSERIQELTDRILQGKTGDYEKAVAIERYFHENGYTYDLSYTPPAEHKDIEYFIFTSKRGSCSDYATAMMLMARSAHLAVRYVEGFLVHERNEEGVYQVTPDNSHAYPEAYIPGYGWMSFEPTVADDSAGGVGVAEKSGIWAIVLGVAGLSAFLGWGIRRSVIPAILEARFRRQARDASGRGTVLMLYTRTLQMIGAAAETPVDSYTPGMLRDDVLQHYEVDVSRLIAAYEAAAFHDAEPSDEEVDAAFRDYRACYKAVR